MRYAVDPVTNLDDTEIVEYEIVDNDADPETDYFVIARCRFKCDAETVARAMNALAEREASTNAPQG